MYIHHGKTKDYETLVEQYFKVKYPRGVPFEGRVSVEIKAYLKIPKNMTKKDIKKVEEGLLSPTKKPDIDNIVKVILDALNKMAFKDDTQITKLLVEKYYAEEESVYIKVEEY
jgi:Holliday junction resolvase RusA-like endonuclease